MKADRIAELRALRVTMDEKFAQREPDKYIPYHKAEQKYRHAVEESTDALLDCAEALQRVQYDMKKFGCLTAETRRVVPAALARLNGDHHD